MTAAPNQQGIAAEFASGERVAERGLYKIGQGVAPSYLLFDDLRDLLEADGLSIQASPRLRGWASRIQKALAAGGE